MCQIYTMCRLAHIGNLLSFTGAAAASESIVQPETQEACRQLIARAGQGVGFAAEVDVEVFGSDGPTRCKADLQAAAHNPAAVQVVFPHAANRHMAAAIGKPECPVIED